MMNLDVLPSLHRGSSHVDEVSVGRKQPAECVHVVLVPSCCESTDNLTDAVCIIRRGKNGGQGNTHHQRHNRKQLRRVSDHHGPPDVTRSALYAKSLQNGTAGFI